MAGFQHFMSIHTSMIMCGEDKTSITHIEWFSMKLPLIVILSYLFGLFNQHPWTWTCPCYHRHCLPLFKYRWVCELIEVQTKDLICMVNQYSLHFRLDFRAYRAFNWLFMITLHITSNMKRKSMKPILFLVFSDCWRLLLAGAMSIYIFYPSFLFSGCLQVGVLRGCLIEGKVVI